PGSRIALPRHLKAERPKNPLSNSELALLAHLLGDGCTVPRQPIHYTSADEENVQIVERAASRLFNIDPRRVRQKNWWHVYLPSPYRLTHGKHNPITQWLVDLGIGLRHAWNKFIPDAVFSCDQFKIRFFLHHLWATDGNISWKRLKGRKPSAAIYYATTSSRLASDVQQLLLRIGIHSTLRVAASEDYRDTHQVHIQGKESQVRFLETVGSAGQRGRIVPELLRALAQFRTNPNTDTIPKASWRGLITAEKERVGMTWRQIHAGIDTAYSGSSLFKSGLSRARMARVAKVLGSESLQDLAESDVFWDEIASIEPRGMEDVYDATVPGVHNFLASDLFVHNSIEQDADVVIFIYREVVGEEEAEPANVADVIVAKHRNGPTGQLQLVFLKDRAQFVSAELRRVTA
ncbi:MAG: LAGLIDADG family homing endonuclease, partial [Anaerolineae bacterium]